MSAREYEARRDLLELHAHVDAGMRPADIARAMGKDPAWISRGIKKLREDPTLAFRKPHESEAIAKTLARLEALYQQAYRAGVKNKGLTRLAAIRTAASILQRISDFQIRVGVIQPLRTKTPQHESEGDAFLATLEEELPPDAVAAALAKLMEVRKRPKFIQSRPTSPYSNNRSRR